MSFASLGQVELTPEFRFIHQLMKNLGKIWDIHIFYPRGKDLGHPHLLSASGKIWEKDLGHPHLLSECGWWGAGPDATHFNFFCFITCHVKT